MTIATEHATPPGMPLELTSLHDLRTTVANWRQAGYAIALVPTMGALHAGHASLMAAAKGAVVPSPIGGGARGRCIEPHFSPMHVFAFQAGNAMLLAAITLLNRWQTAAKRLTNQ